MSAQRSVRKTWFPSIVMHSEKYTFPGVLSNLEHILTHNQTILIDVSPPARCTCKGKTIYA